MRGKRHELIIGVFVLCAILAAAVMILRFGGGYRRHGRYYKLTVYFNSVSGLIVDAPVYYAGVECGKVEEIMPPTEDFPKVRVILQISEDYIIREQDTITISTLGILGDKMVKIIPGDISAPRWPPDSTVKGEDPLDPFQAIDQATAILRSEQFQEDLQGFVSGLADLVNEKNRELFSMTIRNLYLASEGLADDLENLREILSKDTRDSIKNIISSTEEVVSKVAKASEDLPRLTQTLASFVDDNTESMEDLIESLTRSSNDLSNFIRSLRATMRDLSRAQSTIGKLLYEDEIYENLNAVIQGIRFYGLLGFQEHLHQQEMERRKKEEIWDR
jgi:phospholipid/cholesterol/gamma-HCH transport system substrate-binding protein